MPGERQTNNNGESRQQIFNGQAILYDVNAVDTMAPTNQSIDNYSTNFQNQQKHYEEVALIGSGAYGTVYKARDLRNNGEIVALKKVRIPLTEEGVPISLLREISVLKNLEIFDHPNVVRLLDICHGRRLEQERQLVLFLVFEHVDQDLASYLANCPSPGLGPDKIKDLMYQILNGVDFLHSNRIVHRDLKPANILVTRNGQVKLADFGLARIYEQTQILTAVVVTLWYRAPEVLLQSVYASPIDIWSCGCIFAELFTRLPLFGGHSESDQLCKIFQVIGSPLESEWPAELSLPWSTFSNFKKKPFEQIILDICPEGKDLLEKMLIFDANNRIAARQALSHEYFKEYELFPPIYNNQNGNISNGINGTIKTSSRPET